MLPSRGSDLAAPRGRSQPKSTFLHPETLISPSESPRKAQQHVLRYMHACTEPGALGPGQLARRRARPRTRSIQLFGASQQAWKQHHPHWGRELPALPDPPRICICHTFLGALRLPLCVSPGYLTAWVLRTPSLPVFPATPVTPALVTAQVPEDRRREQTQPTVMVRKRYGRYSQFSVRLRRLSSRLSLMINQVHHNNLSEGPASQSSCLAYFVQPPQPSPSTAYIMAGGSGQLIPDQTPLAPVGRYFRG